MVGLLQDVQGQVGIVVDQIPQFRTHGTCGLVAKLETVIEFILACHFLFLYLFIVYSNALLYKSQQSF